MEFPAPPSQPAPEGFSRRARELAESLRQGAGPALRQSVRLAREGALALWHLLRDGWRSFRQGDRFTRGRVVVTAAYLLLAGVSVAVALGRDRLDQALLRGGYQALIDTGYVFVRNTGQEPWPEVRIQVNERWLFAGKGLKPGEGRTYNLELFKDQQGRQAPGGERPREVTLEAGSLELSWSPER